MANTALVTECVTITSQRNQAAPQACLVQFHQQVFFLSRELCIIEIRTKVRLHVTDALHLLHHWRKYSSTLRFSATHKSELDAK